MGNSYEMIQCNQTSKTLRKVNRLVLSGTWLNTANLCSIRKCPTNNGCHVEILCAFLFAALLVGQNCSRPMDACLSRPCTNNGRCENLLNGFRCNCPLGFTGSRCETSQDLCASHHSCHNGAKCVPVGNSVQCRCEAGFEGAK